MPAVFARHAPASPCAAQGQQPEPGRSRRQTSGACGRANARAVRTTKRRGANASPNWPSSSAGPRGTSRCHLRLRLENNAVDDSTVRMKMDSLTYRPHRWVGCAGSVPTQEAGDRGAILATSRSNVRGGLLMWHQSGLPVVRIAAKRRREIERRHDIDVGQAR